MIVKLENTTQMLCVIGDPVLHSKSPLIQNTLLSALCLDYIYLCQPVKREDLVPWLAAAKVAGYAGFNATMPHKEALVPLMDVLDEDAKRCASVNTICIKNGLLYGYSTDGQGFLRALSDHGVSPAGARVVLLGAGGAAKAVALALIRAGAIAVTICNRTVERAEQLCQGYHTLFPCGLQRMELHRACKGADILVNCTSLGMGGTGTQFEDLDFLTVLPKSAFVADLIYHPTETQLLQCARSLGHHGMNGLGMLIHQAIIALEHFTGKHLEQIALRTLIERVLDTHPNGKKEQDCVAGEAQQQNM